MNAAYLEAAYPEPRAVLQVPLLPLSLGHRLLLDRFVPAVFTPDCTIDDVAAGVVVCSQPYAEALRDITSPDLPATLAEFAKRLEKVDQIAELLRWDDYLKSSDKWPPYRQCQDIEGRDIGVPFVQVVKVLLMRELGLTEAQCFDRPWALCLWDFFTIRALDGCLTVISDEEMQGLEDSEELARRLHETLTQTRPAWLPSN